VKIDYLKNHPVIALRLAELCGTEWQHLYTGWNREVALREFESQRADGTLPLSLVAIEQDEPLGMVSIIFDDLPGYEHLNPWLASLFVLPGHRGKETGSRLVREAEKLLANNGVATACLFTESARTFFEKLGWRAIERATATDILCRYSKKTFSRRSSGSE
jgi:predicted N-acetyltransferase YhbS